MTDLTDARIAELLAICEKMEAAGWPFIDLPDFATAAREALPVALAEVQRLRAQSAWRPIESAPKDGTEFLMSSPKREVFPAEIFVGNWFQGSWFHASRGALNYDDGGPDLWSAPTHWMPRPSPPSEKE